jgi:hypothetical protein
MARKSDGSRPPAAPALDQLPLVHASEEVARWLDHYWVKLGLPGEALKRLAVTDDRQEFARWTGRRLNPMALGCYCYLPRASADADSADLDEPPEFLNAQSVAVATAPHLQPALPGFVDEEDDVGAEAVAGDTGPYGCAPLTNDHRHLIFIEPDLLPISAEVTVAHELIHLSDRIHGNPRKHRCHGYDSISVDEAAITGRDPEFLRAQLRDETTRRELALRRIRPYRYIYVCPACKREYPRVRRYARPVSCGRCDKHYNLAFVLQLREVLPGKAQAAGSADARAEDPDDELLDLEG